MIIKINNILIILILSLYNVIAKENIHEIKIKNTDFNDFNDFGKSISELSQIGQIKAVLNSDTYSLPPNGQHHVSVSYPLTFYSKNGSTFDFQANQNSAIQFHFQSENNIKIVFENISFSNFYSSQFKRINMLLIDPTGNSYDFTVEFINCTFIDSFNGIIQTNVRCTKTNQSTPQLLFNNCKFM